MVFEAIREVLRQDTLQDADFFALKTYYFELVIPSSKSLSGNTSFLFPLVINPEQISLEEPFALEETPTLGGGLYVEENGIVRRSLRIKGNFGFKPKPYKASSWNHIAAPDQGRSFSESRPRVPPFAVGTLEFSGQRHFQFLQDNVFRTYADFKRDPATSLETKLYFHNPRDGEHWRVHPRKFMGDRSVPRKTLYPYDLELLVSGPAEDPGADFSEDKNLIDTIKNVFTMIQSGIKLVRGAIRDITNFVAELESIVSGIGNTLDGVIGIIDDASAFVNGVTSFIEVPFEVAAQLSNSLATSLEGFGNAINNGRQIPDTVMNSLRKAEAGLDRINSFPEMFQTPSQRALQAARRSEELSTSNTRAALEAAAAETPPGSFQAFLALGTKNLPGDLDKADAELGIGRGLDQYKSAVEFVVGDGDTLQSLAAKRMGDARKWRAIAVLNGLTEPYISKDGFPGTKKVGDRILIPSLDPPPENRTITPVLGVSPEETAEVRLLGTDFKLKRLTDRPGDFFDFEIDVEAGSNDIKSVSGVENLKQALLVRLRTERGTVQLYKNVGHDRVIATAVPGIDRDQVIFRIGQAVRADPRVVDLSRIDGRVIVDRVEIDMDVQVVGSNGAQTINLNF
jgi:hypothetical protein